jgi:prepilin-type N-terminal cleavage/methylation domain-containing protein
MKPAHGRRGEDGFTLVELLIVLAISGLLTGLMVTGFRTAQSGWQRIAMRDAGHGACKALRQFLSNLLSQAYPAVIDGGAEPKVDFDGGADEVTFLAPLPQRFGAT